MAPVCVCGHKASEHHKQMNIRTYCLVSEYVNEAGQLPTAQGCSCLMYRPKEQT